MAGFERMAYLERLGVHVAAANAPAAPGVDTLVELQEAHLETIPFENLSIQLDEPMELDVDWLVDKITTRRRGGFCYELNGAFAALLEDLGYVVERRSARVYRDDGTLGPPFDHLALVVRAPAEADQRQWLVDVGFGDSFVRPLPLAPSTVVEDPAGTFELRAAGDDGVDLVHDSKPAYRIEPRTYDLTDFRPTWWYHRTSPESGFTRGPVCTRWTGDGRVTLAGRKLMITRDGERTEREVDAPDEALAIYRDSFGIELDRVPGA